MKISSVECSGGPFQMTENTCTGSLPPDGQCSMSATYTAKTIIPANGTITLNDGASSKPQVVELIGIGTEVEISPATLTFPPQKVNTSSAPQTVQVTNVGTESIMSTRSLSINGPDFQDFSDFTDCGSSLAPGTSCIVKVTFRPERTGTLGAAVQINDSGGNSPQYIPLTGTGD